MPTDLAHAVEVARRAVQAGSEAALRYFRNDFVVETKSDQTPVTVADRESEAAIVGAIRAEFPDHDTLGEEEGAVEKGSPYRWIIDPIDGTRGFTRGSNFWGPLVALEYEGDVVVGAMALPSLGQTYWAGKGLGAFRDGQRLEVSKIADWSQAIVSCGELNRLLQPPFRDGVLELTERCASARSYGDLANQGMVLDGRAEIALECEVQLWDVAPIKILVEEAGGRFTNLDGEATLSGDGFITSNGLLHDEALAAFGRVSS